MVHIVFKVTATEGLDDYNHTIFKSIRDVTAYPKDDKTSIEVSLASFHSSNATSL